MIMDDPTVTAYVQQPTQGFAHTLNKRQELNTTAVPPTTTPQVTETSISTPGTTTASTTLTPNTTTVATTTAASSTAVSTTLTTITATISTTSTLSSTATTNATAIPTQSPSSGDTSKGLVIGGAAIGGLVFAIGLAIIAFRCTLNRKERARRNKEMAATLAENFDRSADPIASPRKGYLELGDGPPTPSSGRGANLSRQGSQDAYFAANKEGGGQDYYNPHYVQERYGAANAGTYGMYEETELSVMGGSAGRQMAYPPTSVPTNHYAGYNDYDYGNQQGSYYGGGGQAPRGHQGY
ncbi:hypothetical protein BGZ54_005468 [Gamsiella multidivaricata]|nr:hypothetical protein BGZ54_005468 [Gamsiella multidivaricata]